MDELTAPEGFLLRPWLPADAPAVLRAFEPDEMGRQTDRPVFDLAGALVWIAERTRERGARTDYSWAVVGEKGEALGCVALQDINRTHDTAWVSYWTTESARGQGSPPRAYGRWRAGRSASRGCTGWSWATVLTTTPPAGSPGGPGSRPRESSGAGCATAAPGTTSSGTPGWPTMLSTLIDERVMST